MLIKGGRVVFDTGVLDTDIRINGRHIEKVEPDLTPHPGEEVIDAKGKLVMPGGVDVHTHFSLDVGIAVTSDDFYTGTIAAAFGGTTSVVDHMGFGPKGCTIRSRVEHYHELADDKAVVDYSFHGVISHVDDNILQELEGLIADGITSQKFYLTYGDMLHNKEVLPLMQRARELGIMLCMHCESDDLIYRMKQDFISAGKTSAIYHAKSRPEESEAEAVERMILFAKSMGDAPIYIVHLSSKLALDLIKEAKDRGQKNIYAETCPQYLYLNEELYKNDDALKYIMSPPLRSKDSLDALWSGINEGYIDTVATDHCPFPYNPQKLWGANDFTKSPNGSPGVETRMMLMLSAAFQGKIKLETVAKVCCSEPAKLFGLYPQKGSIRVGADADIVIYEYPTNATISKSMLHENIDYTPFEGIEINAVPHIVLSRGELIIKDREFIGEKGRGEFLKRKLSELNCD